MTPRGTKDRSLTLLASQAAEKVPPATRAELDPHQRPPAGPDGVGPVRGVHPGSRPTNQGSWVPGAVPGRGRSQSLGPCPPVPWSGGRGPPVARQSLSSACSPGQGAPWVPPHRRSHCLPGQAGPGDPILGSPGQRGPTVEKGTHSGPPAASRVVHDTWSRRATTRGFIRRDRPLSRTNLRCDKPVRQGSAAVRSSSGRVPSDLWAIRRSYLPSSPRYHVYSRVVSFGMLQPPSLRGSVLPGVSESRLRWALTGALAGDPISRATTGSRNLPPGVTQTPTHAAEHDVLGGSRCRRSPSADEPSVLSVPGGPRAERAAGR